MRTIAHNDIDAERLRIPVGDGVRISEANIAECKRAGADPNTASLSLPDVWQLCDEPAPAHGELPPAPRKPALRKPALRKPALRKAALWEPALRVGSSR